MWWKMGKGVFFAIAAASLFGFVYYFPVLLQPLSVVEIFCWRLLMSCPAIAILITFERGWNKVFHLLNRIKKRPILLFAILFSSSMLSVQMMIFIWAPLNGRALSTSLGYFILPLAMVVGGAFVYKEKFSIYQKIAIAFAIVAALHEIWVTGAFSWETIVVSVGYPIYLIFRRKMNINGIEGTFFDFLFMAIGCGIFMVIHDTGNGILISFLSHPFAIPMLGIITAIGFAMYFAGAELLPLGLFGLLSYLEPILLTIVAIFFLHERLSAEHVFTYVMIWAAVCILAIEGTVYAIRGIARRKLVNKVKRDVNK